MPPQRAKLYNKTGKVKVINQQSKPSNNQRSDNPERSAPVPSTSTSSNQQDSETERQFMTELYWCVQQLENSLNSGKLNQKQAQDTEKSLKILKSSNQPIIKKRQIMRASFGDYRAKMAEEEKKFSLGLKQIKFTNNGVNTKEKKSYFVKKCALLTSGKDFKFNFPINEIEQLNISEKREEINNSQEKEYHKNNNDFEAVKSNPDEANTTNTTNSFDFKYIPSGNVFRFNFDIDSVSS